MLEQMKAMGALAGLLKNKEKLREVGERFKDRLGELRATGQSGGGAVKVTVTGHMMVERIEIAPALASHMASADSRAMAEALVRDASNAALAEMRDLVQREAAKLSDEMGLPPLPGLLGGS